MKKYEIEINNEVYRVSVKELPADADMSVHHPSSTVEVDETAAAPAAQPTSAEGGTQIKAPMAGTILNILVTPGQHVAEGESLVVLEAMKMENEIVAPAAGVVGEVFVALNDRVESDQVLLTI